MTNAKTLTAALGGKWRRRYGVAPCPVCQPERRKDQDALTLSDGPDRLFAHCKKTGCGFRDILVAAGVTPGTYQPPDPLVMARRRAEEQAEALKRAGQAQRLWAETLPVQGSLAETYLRHRGIVTDLPETLRFHPTCWHLGGKYHPALVALVEGGTGFAVHRTYLRGDGTGKAAVEPDKAMLGAVAGGAVRLSEGAGPLVVAEGLETSLSLLCGLLRAPATVWAALSTSGIRGLILPKQSARMTIAADGDAAGRGAAHDLAARAHGLGWQVSMLLAPDGKDWNDVLTGKEDAA